MGGRLAPSRGPLRVRRAQDVAWTPPYALPGQGETLNIAGNAPTDVTPSGLTSTQWVTATLDAFGGGAFVSDYSDGGAYVVAGSGGHASPESNGALVIDFHDGFFRRIDPTEGGYRASTYTVADTNGTPYYEISGTTQCPAPAHPYSTMVALSTSLGGGTKGSVVYATRSAITSTAVHSNTAHRFDLATGQWSRLSSDVASREVGLESAAILDAARSRYWILTGAEHSFKSRLYYDLNTLTFNLTADSTAAFPDSDAAAGALFMHQGLVIRNTAITGSSVASRLFCYDPDDNASGIFELTISGTMPTKNEGRALPWTYFPATGKFYKVPIAGGTSIWRLTPPASPKSGTWVVDTVTVSPSLPAVSGFSATDWTGLFYVPSIQRLAYINGGATSGIYLIYPAT